MTACDSCYLNFKEKRGGLFTKKVYCDYYLAYVMPVNTCAAQLQKNHSEIDHKQEIEQLLIKKQQLNFTK